MFGPLAFIVSSIIAVGVFQDIVVPAANQAVEIAAPLVDKAVEIATPMVDKAVEYVKPTE
jgi:hypothetical protein|tara:strand:- start:299 stop:478 length:180 start_codon:yes stop_codon:yes gene_type:complete